MHNAKCQNHQKVRLSELHKFLKRCTVHICWHCCCCCCFLGGARVGREFSLHCAHVERCIRRNQHPSSVGAGYTLINSIIKCMTRASFFPTIHFPMFAISLLSQMITPTSKTASKRALPFTYAVARSMVDLHVVCTAHRRLLQCHMHTLRVEHDTTHMLMDKRESYMYCSGRTE